MSLKQSLAQRTDMRLSPQQIQLMKLLQIPTIELSQRIKEEIESNPVLEEGTAEDTDNIDPNNEYEQAEDIAQDEQHNHDDVDILAYFDEDTHDYKTQMNYRQQTQEQQTIPIAGVQSFHERLIDQLAWSDLDETQRQIADFIVGSLDDSGYLNREIRSIVDDLAFSMNIITNENEVENVLKAVQELEPAGVGARNLRECLMIQLKRNHNEDANSLFAYTILDRYFEEFSMRHYNVIQTNLELSDHEMKDIIDKIMKLNPKPGGESSTTKENAPITPDFIVSEFEGRLELTINSKNAPDLRLNKRYKKLLSEYTQNVKATKSEKITARFVQQKIDSAKSFIEAIQIRQNTLLVTMKAIMQYQKEFFLTGDETTLRPMILKDIANAVELDISTISRVVSSKYVQTDYGIFSLRYFFSEAVYSNQGKELTVREMKRLIVEAVENEDKKKPLTDERLAEIFNNKGYQIARRTIAKHREQLNIPVARMRKEL